MNLIPSQLCVRNMTVPGTVMFRERRGFAEGPMQGRRTDGIVHWD